MSLLVEEDEEDLYDDRLLAAQQEAIVNRCDDDSENQRHRPAPLACRQWLTVALLMFAGFSVTLCFALLVSFFPEEARRKGATEWQTGFIFSVYELGGLLSSPLYGKYLTHIGSKFLFVTGVFCLASSTILFGTLAFCPNGMTFVLMCLAVRSFQGVSGAAQNTALMAIVACSFPGRVTTILGVIESSCGLAYIAGPLIGGVLFQVGGFVLPFLAVGGVNLSMALACCILLPSEKEVSLTHPGGIFHFLKLPGVWFPVATILAVTITMSFLDLSLSPKMDTFDINTAMKGCLFVVMSATYVIMGPLWGKIANRKGFGGLVMACGAFISFGALFVMGPSPLLMPSGSLWLLGTSLGILGVGIGAQVVPPFPELLLIATAHGYPDNLHTAGLVSGLTNMLFPLGSFIGPSIGGFLGIFFGFSWSTTGLAFANLSLGLAFLLNRFRWGCRKRSGDIQVSQNGNGTTIGIGKPINHAG